jgi:hypothetical protein
MEQLSNQLSHGSAHTRMHTLIVIRPYHPYRASLLRRSHKTFCSKRQILGLLETGNQTDIYLDLTTTNIQNSGPHN